jgi:hypothetical protein
MDGIVDGGLEGEVCISDGVGWGGGVGWVSVGVGGVGGWGVGVVSGDVRVLEVGWDTASILGWVVGIICVRRSMRPFPWWG